MEVSILPVSMATTGCSLNPRYRGCQGSQICRLLRSVLETGGMGEDAREAVRLYVLRVRDLAGGAPALAHALRAELGDSIEEPAINAWTQEKRTNEPSGRYLFAMRRRYPTISLDEYAMGAPEHAALQAQVDQLRRDLDYLRRELEGKLADLGLPIEAPASS